MASWTATVINCTYLNVRSQPSASSKILHVLNKGYSTTATKTKSGWYYLSSKKGWVNGKFLKIKAIKPATKSSKKTAKKSANKKKSIKIPLDKKKFISAKDIAKAKKSGASALKKVKATTAKGYKIKPVEMKKKIKKGLGNTDIDSQLSSPRKLLKTSSVSTMNDFVSSELFPQRNEVNSAVEGTETGAISKSILDTMRRNLNVYNNSDYYDLFKKFNRLKTPVVDYPMTKSIPYVFFTRPGIRLYDDNGVLLPAHEGTYFQWMNKNHNLAAKSLTNHFSSSHKFNPFLSNAVESFELSDEIIKTVEHGETYTGWRNVYARNTNESNTASQVNISYTEDKKMTIYNMHKLWLDYMSQMQRGYLIPANAYLHKKIIDYACSIYYILCAQDGESILYWAKYTGVFPLNTPSSAFSWTKGTSPSVPKITVNYSYAIKEEMNPIILTEFNYLSRNDPANEYRPIYDDVLNMVTNGMTGMPYVEGNKFGTVDSNFKLRFRSN